MIAGSIIRAARLRAGLTQAELGLRTGHAASEISRWERGAVSPSFDAVGELTEACGLQLAWSLVAADDSYRANIAPRLALAPPERLAAGLRHSRSSQRIARSASQARERGDARGR